MKRIILVFMVMMFLIGWSAEGQAQYEKVAGFQEHDGFFLRFHGGAGSGKMVEQDLPGSDMILTGLASVFRFQIGGSISDNLVLFGELGGFIISDPEVDYGENSGALEDTDLSISDFGGGLTYYFMPSNFYISGTFTLSKNEIKIRPLNVVGETEMGYGAYLSVGKEWWVSADWGLGVAGFYYFSNTTDKEAVSDKEYPVSNSIFGVVFSATYH